MGTTIFRGKSVRGKGIGGKGIGGIFVGGNLIFRHDWWKLSSFTLSLSPKSMISYLALSQMMIE